MIILLLPTQVLFNENQEEKKRDGFLEPFMWFNF